MQKVWSEIKYLLGYIVPIGTFVTLHWAGRYSFIVPFYAFVVIPVLEVFLPQSDKNYTPAEEESRLKNRFFDVMLYLNVPIQFALLGYMLYQVAWGDFFWWEKAGMVIAMGISCGVLGINVAHELGHRLTKWEQQLSKALLLTSLYMHFFIEHNRGHHKNVSTPLDPASARYGETIYSFYFRTIIGSFRSAWQLEKKRLKRSGLPVWSWKNEMIRFQVYQVLFMVLIGFVFGSLALLAFILSAIIGILLLETVNYIEHYGLRRKEIEPGIYETVKPTHSWNSNHALGRIMLYELTRHSDHHYKATRKYQVLRHFDESPQLPLGYPGSIVVALIPPLWFSLMNPRVKKWEKINLTAN